MTDAAAEVRELNALSTWVGGLELSWQNRVSSSRTLTILQFRGCDNDDEGGKQISDGKLGEHWEKKRRMREERKNV
jgi:hypothetical protein